MPIRYLKTHAALEGVVTAEDAEALAQWLQARRKPKVRLGACEHLHAAALQSLLAWKPTVTDPHAITDPLLATLLARRLGAPDVPPTSPAAPASPEENTP